MNPIKKRYVACDSHSVSPMSSSSENTLLHIRNQRDVGFFDLCSVDQIQKAEEFQLIFELACAFRNTGTEKLSLCKGHSMINAFFEHSTRTMSSFDLAAKHLGMDTHNVGSTSSVKKGESLLDTTETIDSYGLSVVVIRSRQAGVPEMISKHVRASILNAGDGWHEHPTQALLDGLTMLDYFQTETLEGKVVTVVGDILHSRVFGSLVRLLAKLKATIRVAAPDTFFPEESEKFGIQKFYNVEEALSGADVVYALRVQEERGSHGFIPTLREYSKTFGISEKRFKLAKKNAILMHPGPVIRDIDVHSALVAHPQSRILQQVENGLAIRKALLWLTSVRYDGKRKPFHHI